ncbi:MAG: haloacid dehalogenase type II [Burkholderiales bacterium]
MTDSRPPRAIAFDAFGTLFDVHSVRELADALFPENGEALSQLWRTKQLEYTWLRTMSDRYVDFVRITEDSLRYAAKRLQLVLSGEAHARLMDQYLRLSAFPEVRQVLHRLKASGLRLAVLSNGTPAMLDALTRHAGLDGVFDHLLSVDAVKTYKTDFRAYQLAPHAFNLNPQEIMFVSSNGWDASAGAWFGFRAFWVNRSGLPREELGVAPEAEGSSLADLPAYVAAQS